MESKHRASIKKITFLPSEQAHGLSPLEQIFCHLKFTWEQKMGEFVLGHALLHSCHYS